MLCVIRVLFRVARALPRQGHYPDRGTTQAEALPRQLFAEVGIVCKIWLGIDALTASCAPLAAVFALPRKHA